MERFAYLAAHDVQAPLKTIRGFIAEIASEFGDSLTPHLEMMIDRISSGAERVESLFEAQLDYARICAAPLNAATVPLASTVEAAWEEVSGGSLELEAHLDPGPLPIVYGDESMLDRLFVHLFDNGIKFRSPGSRPRLEVSAREAGPIAEVCVSDNGIGLRAEAAADIFEPFRRLHPSNEYPGAGIGLAICKEIVVKHGGEIWAESEPPGTRIYFTIPLPGLEAGGPA